MTAFAVSALVTLLLVRSAKLRPLHGFDLDFDKPQGVHAVAVPRIGGLGVVLGLFVAQWYVAVTLGRDAVSIGLLLLACALPAFLAGFVQDMSESLTPRGRLAATAVSAVLAFFLLDAGVREASLPGVDWLVSTAAGSLLVTVFAVTGIANAVNIIDGLNGLASMCACLMLAAVAYVAFQVGDPLVGTLALAGIGAVGGFFLWNYPFGLIFLGDGGAYFLGFFLAELSILLLMRNPEVSPIFPLLVCIYPIFETIFSMYRRSFLRAAPSSMPDGIHLHSLIFRRLLRWTIGDQSALAITRRNSMASPILWLLCTLSIVPAMLFWDQASWLLAFLLLFAVTYVVLYWRIVRFKSPRWLRIAHLGQRGALHGDERNS